jgi:CBS domain-containing protein
MGKTVRDAMTTDPYVIRPEASSAEAADLMAEGDVGAIPVVDAENRLLGIVTDRDIAVRVVAARRDPRSTRVDEIASTRVSPAYPDEPLNEAIEQMTYRQVRRLPVVEDERVVGMLSQADVVHEVRDKKAGQLIDAISNPVETSQLVDRLSPSDGGDPTG